MRIFQPVCIVLISPPEIELCDLCVNFVRVVHCLRFSDPHTASQHVVPLHVARNRPCAYSMVPEQHKIHAQNTQIRLDYWFY